MKLRLMALAAAPVAFLGSAALPSCEPPAPLLDLEFSCVYDDGVTVFTVENRTGTGRFYVAYDRDSDWRLGTPQGDYEFYLGAHDSEAIELTSEFDIDLVTIARRPPSPTPGQPGFAAYDKAVAGTESCGTGD